MEGPRRGCTGGIRPAPEYLFQARRLFFLGNYGRAATALVDAAWIAGFSLWRVRRWAQRKPDQDPPRPGRLDPHSVFCAGFEIPVAGEPALRDARYSIERTLNDETIPSAWRRRRGAEHD